jgi:hypothetical protein
MTKLQEPMVQTEALLFEYTLCLEFGKLVIGIYLEFGIFNLVI